MYYFIIIYMCILLDFGIHTTASIEIIYEIDEILDRKSNFLKDLSSCTGEVSGLVNEAAVLSISVEDVVDKLKGLARETENEIRTYTDMKRNISQMNTLHRLTDHKEQARSDVHEIENTDVDEIPEIQLPQAKQYESCFRNTWARNYYDGSEMGHGGLTWKRGLWQRIGRKKTGQLGLHLRSISLSTGVGICYITGMAVLKDGTIAATDRSNFVLSLYNLDGVKQKDIYFEPLLLNSVTVVPGQTRKVILSTTLLDNTNAKLMVDIDDGSKVILEEKVYARTMNQSKAIEKKITSNCTIEDSRIYSYRQFYRSPSGDSFYGTYGQKTVIQYDRNCNYKGVFAGVKYRQRIVGLTGIADLVMVQFHRGGRQLDNDRINIYKIP